ncbi:hypothetical protein JL720_15697 [Aureococcus anophagefferens]|nr:hypothetical protein JL720_15697 [Aureococcus anophagefferens]
MERSVFDGEALAGEERRCKSTVDVLELAIQAEETMASASRLVEQAAVEFAAREAGELDSDSDDDEERAPRATVLKRKVLSFCLYGAKPIYCAGAVQNAHLAKALLPDWKCRLLHPATRQETCAALTAAGAELRLVSSRRREAQLMLLRFLPCGDAGVEAVAVRDADSG